ncbi:MAG: aldehyde dehydrogenase [Starkeya sp.]|nr:aldehyde dehydrogenase [Starkeya sp.]
MTALRDDFRLYIDGAFVHGGASFESLDPATGQPWAVMPAATAADVNRAVEAAHRAFDAPEWANLTATARGKLLMKLGDLVAAHAQELAALETRDTGKIIRETRAQIGYVAEYYRYFGGLADKVEGSHLPVDKPDMEAWLRREPIGVVAAVVPWNSQLFLSAVKLGPALAAGCTVVLKASEEGPAPLLAFAKLVHEAGFPPGVVNIITGFGEECGKTLTAHKLVSRVAFTGGPATARHVVRNTAENLAFTTLELGGKSPVLVFADADLESAANAVVAGIFAASGQSCVAGSRLFVEESVRDKLLAILTEKARRIRIGDPQDPATEMGPLATARQLAHIEQVVAASLAAGATLVTGGTRAEGFTAGNYYAPTILACAGNEVPCAAEELFGPVLSVIRWSDYEQMIAEANDVRYGLASGIYTSNLAHAWETADRLQAGSVWINNYCNLSGGSPFGGFKESGIGSEFCHETLNMYTHLKSVTLQTRVNAPWFAPRR